MLNGDICIKGSRRLLLWTAALILAVNTAYSVEGYGIFALIGDSGPSAPDSALGIYRANFATGEIRHIWTPPNKARDYETKIQFIENGRRIAAFWRGRLFFMNNDGTNVQEFSKPIPNFSAGRGTNWTTNGIMWVDAAHVVIHRYELESSRYSQIPLKAGPGISLTAVGCGDQASIDGKYWIQNGASITTTVADDFSSATTNWHCTKRGHGNSISGDGRYIYMYSLGECQIKFGDTYLGYDPSIFPFRCDTVFRTDPGLTAPFQWDRFCSGCVSTQAYADYTLITWGGPGRVVNNSEYIFWGGSANSGPARNKYVIAKWTDPKVIDTVSGPKVSMTTPGHMEAWLGPLPSPHSDAYIVLEKQSVQFTINDMSQNPPPVTIAVVNKGTPRKMVGLTSSVAPAAPWLEVSLVDAASDTQAVRLVVDAAKFNALGTLSAACTVTISCQHCPTHDACVVTAYRSTTLPAPGNLSASLGGDSLMDVTLAWTDNSINEQGFIVEHSVDTIVWKVIDSLPANYTKFQDFQASYGRHYYRVRAFSAVFVSEYSPVLPVSVVGVPWIHLVSPRGNELIRAGSSYMVRWEANLITQFMPYYSPDNGASWEAILDNPLDADARSYAWPVPASLGSNFRIRVTDYQMDNIAVSGSFTLSNRTDTPLPAGQLERLLQLENPTGSAYLSEFLEGTLTNAAVRQVGWRAGDTLICNGVVHTWNERSSISGLWADGDKDGFVSFGAISIANPLSRRAKIAYRNDDDITVYMNGTQLFSKQGWDGRTEQMSPSFTLPQEAVSFVIKLREGGGENWYGIRFTDTTGADLSDLTFTLSSAGSVPTRGHSTVRALALKPNVVLASRGGRLILHTGSRICQAELLDISGSVVAQGIGSGSFFLINNRAASPGVYLLRIVGDDRTLVKNILLR